MPSPSIALVTGASRGIGRAIAERLGREGFHVLVHFATSQAAAAEVAHAITAHGATAELVQADLAASNGAQSLAEQTIAALNRRDAALSLLVNNAGIQTRDGMDAITEADCDQLLAVNFKAPLFLVQRLLAHLRDGGRIVNISSGLSHMAFPEKIAYGMTKAAINIFTRSLAKQLGPRGITVNAVGPGIIATDMNPWLRHPGPGRDRFAAMAALHRIGEAADVADVVAFLASDDSRWITGSYLDASGGALL